MKKDNSIFLKGKLFNLQKNGCTDKIWLIELLNNLYNSIGSIELLPEIKLVSLISLLTIFKSKRLVGFLFIGKLLYKIFTFATYIFVAKIILFV